MPPDSRRPAVAASSPSCLPVSTLAARRLHPSTTQESSRRRTGADPEDGNSAAPPSGGADGSTNLERRR